MAILADTGFLIALLDSGDRHHESAKKVLKERRGPFIVPSCVLPEVCYLAQKYLGAPAEMGFLAGLSSGEMPVDWSKPEDFERALEFLHKRPDIGFVDAMFAAAAERLKITSIATLDRRLLTSAASLKSRLFSMRGR